MKTFLDKRREKLIQELSSSSSFGGKHPTSVADLREAAFRDFITDIFPYYDAFKGNVNGKSCDFILANNLDHPRYNSIAGDFYPHVVMSAVDCVIDLKGTNNKKEIMEGINQAEKVKEISRPIVGSRGVTRGYDTLRNYWGHLTARHGVVFASGTSDNILKHIKEWIGGKKTFFRVQDKDENITEEAIENPIRELDKELIKKVYRLPDFFYCIESNELILVDKDKIFKGEYGICDLSIYVVDSPNSLYILTFLLEKYSNERDNAKMRQHFLIELTEHITAVPKGLFYNFSNDMKWLDSKRHDIWKITDTEKQMVQDLLGINSEK